MSRRTICRPCYNKEKVTQRIKRIPDEHEDECTKCFKIQIIPKGRRWCKECKNDYEKVRKSKWTETKKDEEKQKNQEYYNKTKENVKEIVINNLETKLCTICNETKTLDNYFIAKCKGTIRAGCKECDLKKKKEYYQANKKQIIKQTTNYQIARCKIDPIFNFSKNDTNTAFNVFAEYNPFYLKNTIVAQYQEKV